MESALSLAINRTSIETKNCPTVRAHFNDANPKRAHPFRLGVRTCRFLSPLPRENEIGSVLLHLRADEGEFIPFAKPYTHVVEERLRAEIYVDGVRAIFHEPLCLLVAPSVPQRSP